MLGLKPPSSDHWNITSDLVFPVALEECRRQREARQVIQGLEGRPEKVKVSPTEAPAPAESLQPVAGSSGTALPIKTVHHGE